MARSLSRGLPAERAQLLGVGDGVALELAGLLDLVGAHPPQRRRVGMNRDGGAVTGVHDAGGVRRGGRERVPPGHRARRLGPTQHETVLPDGSARDGHGAGGEVVVVEPGVVVLHPADEPDLDVLVADELLVGARLWVVMDAPGPQVGPGGHVGGQPAQLGLVERAVARVGGHAASASRWTRCSRRAGLATVIASRAAGPSWPPGASSTTGRADPARSWSIPTTRTRASTVRGPYEDVS